MVFNASWYTNVFFPEYKRELQRLIQNKEITTDQGMLTLLAQTFPEVTLITPSYERIAERMFTFY